MKLMNTNNQSEYSLQIPDDCFQRGIDIMLHAMTKKSSVVITLPSLKDEVRMRGFFKVFLFDTERNAGTNSIILKAKNDEKINGVSEIELEANGVGGMIVPVNQQDWMFFPPFTPKYEKLKKDKEEDGKKGKDKGAEVVSEAQAK